MSVAVQQGQEHEVAFKRLFPLPLTTFETLMVVDSRADYPMLCDLQLHLQGHIERTAFTHALDYALSRAPLFRSLIKKDPRGGYVWLLGNEQPTVDWGEADEPLGDQYDAPLDLVSECGLRIWVRQGEQQATVLLHMHHACSDALGAFCFIEDLLAGYHTACTDVPLKRVRPLQPELLLDRGGQDDTSHGFYRGLIDTFIGAREAGRFFLQRPAPLPAPQSKDGEPTVDCEPRAYIARRCPEHVSEGIRQVAEAAGATVNDVLLRDLFVTLRDWSVACGSDPKRRWLRVLMPQNLRQRADRGLPTANKVGFSFVARRAHMADRPDELLRSLQEETRAIRRGELSRYFLGGLAAVHSAGALNWLMHRPFCFATAVLTNLSDPTRRFVTSFPRSPEGARVGNLAFQGISGGSHLRPQTAAVFSVFNQAKQLTINLKCDRQRFSVADTEHLLDAYLAQLQNTAESA